MSGEYMASRLHQLIEEEQISLIQVYRFSDAKLYQQSEQWRFGHEYIEVGGQSYNLNRVITFLVEDQVLCLYF